MQRFSTVLPGLVLLLLSTGCHGKLSTAPSGVNGGSPGSIPCSAGVTGSTGTASGSMSADINGVRWTADCFGVVLTSATIAISAVDLNGTAQILGLGTTRAIGTGTVGLPSATTGHLGFVKAGDIRSWGAQLNTGSGTVQITALTNSSVAGTFNFVMEPFSGSGATGTKTVTNGTFNLTF